MKTEKTLIINEMLEYGTSVMGYGEKDENVPITFTVLLFFILDTYVVLEMDSYGHFFKKAKTKPARGQDPVWDEVSETNVLVRVMLQCQNKAFQIKFFHYTFCNIAILKLIILYYLADFLRERQKPATCVCSAVNNTVFIMS